MSLELKPTDENVIKTIEANVLQRNNNIKNFVKILYAMNEQNIISLNGDWGTGKTFFIKQVIEVIKCLSFENYIIDERLNDFIKNFEKDLKEIDTKNQIFPIYYNAWEYDSNEDPLLTLIYSLIEQNPNLSDNDKPSESMRQKIYKIISSFKVGLSFADNNTGKSVGIELQCNPQKNIPITKDVISIEGLKDTFNQLLEEIKVEKANKLVIFIDELDRCNPKFAIKLLERIKHFFDNDEFIFVFSTNLNELQYTVKKFYGEGIDGYLYLDKFFDLQFTLPNINIENYINSLNIIHISQSRYFDTCVREMARIYNFSLRNCNRYIKLVSITYNFIQNSSSYLLAKVILFPILLAIKMKDIGLYNKIVNGNAEIEFKNIILQSEELIKVFNHYFQTEDDKSNLTFDFSQLYNCIFNTTKDGWEEIAIGSKTIEYAQERKVLFEMLTFLNDFVIYQ